MFFCLDEHVRLFFCLDDDDDQRFLFDVSMKTSLKIGSSRLEIFVVSFHRTLDDRFLVLSSRESMARGRYNQLNGYSIGNFSIVDFKKKIVHFSKDFFRV